MLKALITLLNLQKLCGTLNFLCHTIFAGRTFLRRLYDKTANPCLKQYHHIRVTHEMREDCLMWLQFLSESPVNRVLCRPFVDLKTFDTSETLNFYTDSSANKKLGFGCIFNNRWMFRQWEENFVQEKKTSIEYLELATLCIGVITWGHLLRDRCIIIFCDNQAVVQMVNNQTSKCPNCMVLIRKLVLDSLKNNRRVFVRYVFSKANFLADSLSHMKLKLFRKLTPATINQLPDKPTELLWPLSKVWQDV